jgi:adenylate cyclase
VTRRLAAILVADVVGYSSLMEAGEQRTLDRLKERRRDILNPVAHAHGGRIVKLMGDGALLEFPSAVGAVEAALQLQDLTGKANAASPGEAPIQLRIGINLGDVIGEGADLYGEGVNVAARLEPLAGAGGIALTAKVHDEVAGKVACAFESLGMHALKNISRPVHVWRIAMHGERAAAAAVARLPLPDKPSIAVLPFDNMSSDPGQDYFADAVVEALTAALSRIGSFFVIARNSAFAYKGKAVDVVTVGRELGVAYVLEGSVQKAGNRVRITVQLIETEAAAHVWTEKYDAETGDIFDLQDRIAEQVAGAMSPSIRLAEIARSSRKRPQDMTAYDYTMRAFGDVWKLGHEETAAGLALLEKALEADPSYPLALALAAWCHAQQSVYTWVDDTASARAKALALAEQAATYSASDPLVLTVLGAVHTFARNHGTARALLERAVSLDPNSAWAWSRLGWLAVYADQPEEARTHFERALRLSPLDPMNFNNRVGIGSSYTVEGDDVRAAAMFEYALAEQPSALWLHRNLAPALLGAGRLDAARASYAALMKAYPGFTVRRFREGMVFTPRVLDRIGRQLIALGVPEE